MWRHLLWAPRVPFDSAFQCHQLSTRCFGCAHQVYDGHPFKDPRRLFRAHDITGWDVCHGGPRSSGCATSTLFGQGARRVDRDLHVGGHGRHCGWQRPWGLAGDVESALQRASSFQCESKLSLPWQVWRWCLYCHRCWREWWRVVWWIVWLWFVLCWKRHGCCSQDVAWWKSSKCEGIIFFTA